MNVIESSIQAPTFGQDLLPLSSEQQPLLQTIDTNCTLQHHDFLRGSLPTNIILLISQKAILLKDFLFLLCKCIAIQSFVDASAKAGQM